MDAGSPRVVASLTVAMLTGAAATVAVLLPVAGAASFSVNTTLDTEDARPGDGKCADDSRACSLRAAVTEANASAGDDTIALPAGAYTMGAGGEDDTNAAGDYDFVPNDGSKITVIGSGTGTTAIEGAGHDRVLHILGGTAEVRNLTVRAGSASSGAAALIASGAALTLRDVEIRDHAGRQSAIHSEGTLNFARLTVSGTTVGGAGIVVASGSASVTNATITGNSGAGIRATGGTVVLNHATVALNTGSGLEADGTGMIKVGASLIAGNAGTQCVGKVESRGFNVVGGTSCPPAGTDVVGADPRLGPLAANGGATRTMLPAADSAAIDVVSGDKCRLSDDQRGRRRPTDGDGNGSKRCDAGAVELDSADLATTTTPTTARAASPTTGPPSTQAPTTQPLAPRPPTTQPPASPVTGTPSIAG